MQSLQTQVGELDEMLAGLSSQLQGSKSRWKKHWEQELQMIASEQQFLKQQEQQFNDLDDDHAELSELMEKLSEVTVLKANVSAVPLDFVPPPLPDEFSESDLRNALLLGISSGGASLTFEERSARRVKAAEKAAAVRTFSSSFVFKDSRPD